MWWAAGGGAAAGRSEAARALEATLEARRRRREAEERVRRRLQREVRRHAGALGGGPLEYAQAAELLERLAFVPPAPAGRAGAREEKEEDGEEEEEEEEEAAAPQPPDDAGGGARKTAACQTDGPLEAAAHEQDAATAEKGLEKATPQPLSERERLLRFFLAYMDVTGSGRVSLDAVSALVDAYARRHALRAGKEDGGGDGDAAAGGGSVPDKRPRAAAADAATSTSPPPRGPLAAALDRVALNRQTYRPLGPSGAGGGRAAPSGPGSPPAARDEPDGDGDDRKVNHKSGDDDDDDDDDDDAGREARRQRQEERRAASLRRAREETTQRLLSECTFAPRLVARPPAWPRPSGAGTSPALRRRRAASMGSARFVALHEDAAETARRQAARTEAELERRLAEQRRAAPFRPVLVASAPRRRQSYPAPLPPRAAAARAVPRGYFERHAAAPPSPPPYRRQRDEAVAAAVRRLRASTPSPPRPQGPAAAVPAHARARPASAGGRAVLRCDVQLGWDRHAVLEVRAGETADAAATRFARLHSLDEARRERLCGVLAAELARLASRRR